MDISFLKKGYIAVGILLLLVILFTFSGCTQMSGPSLDDLKVQNFNGDRISLTSYLGKPVVVNFWETGCAPCIIGFPEFEKVKQHYKDEVIFVMISDEDRVLIGSFASSRPFTFSYVKSEKELSAYGVHVKPTTWLFDSEGALVAKKSEELSAKELITLIEEIK
ncbi:TlpA disulfide reductase family protein [Aquimarina sp. 2201CG1-2-11]|uniref:TlpA family protein disulfide reductase n=1 Tax=Aquimarina discodermiae TaxID=3231043 RepID=UPI003462CA95